MKPQEQHQIEIEKNLESWRKKPLLQEIYRGFYERILRYVDRSLPGKIVELGSGIGNLKSHLPGALCTDLFPNPWLDVVCDGYELPFGAGTISHLVLFDVFHHLQAPRAFLREARRVLGRGGRVILFEPYISLCSFPIYGVFHHEPVAWHSPVNVGEEIARPRAYYAAQGNATRLLFSPSGTEFTKGWQILSTERFSAFHYLLSGGYSKPAVYPKSCLKGIQAIDSALSHFPKLFAARCLAVLTPAR